MGFWDKQQSLSAADIAAQGKTGRFARKWRNTTIAAADKLDASGDAAVKTAFPSSLRLGGPDMSTKAKSELFSALFKLHHLANCMYHRLEENEAKRSSLLPFGGDQI